MNKFKCGDKVRLKKSAIDWGRDYYNCTWTFPDEQFSAFNESIEYFTDRYPDDFELAEEKLAEPSPEKHIHHDMIVEWAANPSRVVQYLDVISGKEFWYDCPNQPAWNPETRYQFKPEEPERVFPTTSLTDDELQAVFDKSNGDFVEVYRDIANAAIKRYILEQETK